MSDLLPGLPYRDFVAEAVRHRKESALRASELYHRWGAGIDALLETPVPLDPARAGAASRAGGRAQVLRVAHWNIEKGKKLAGIRDCLRTDPWIRDADILTLNEVDVGMARTKNADVGREIARALGWAGVFLPNYVECTKGLPRERSAPGENERGLHGIAILSRWPIRDVRVAKLPPCWDYFDFPEKRFGGRRGLYVLLDGNGRDVIVGTTHLEMRGNPPCRGRQFRAFLDGLSRAAGDWGRDLAAVVTGDWNTHTFRRGGRLNSVKEYLRIVSTPRKKLERDLVQPFALEPLFDGLKSSNFSVDGINEAMPTASQALDTVEDLGHFPEWFGRGLVSASGLRGRVLQMRLDWIAVKGLEGAGPPLTVMPFDPSGEPLSDHALIGADLRVPGSSATP